MKNLNEYLDDTVVNESLGTISLIAATIFFSTMMMVGAASSNASMELGDADSRSPWQIVKDDISGFFKDRKLKKIAEKYKDDPEIKEYLENPRKTGWRKMLGTKLEPEEIQYINSLTRSYFK